MIRALLVEDNPGDARLVRALLQDAEADAVALDQVDRLAAGVQHLQAHTIDVVLLDLSLPDSQGFETFAALHAQVPDVPIVVMSGLDDQALAVRAVKEGAQDYLVKGRADGGAILRSLRYAIERARLQQASHDLERQKDEFFASISHDLRTPVAAIKAAVGVVLANEPTRMSPGLHRMLVNIDLASDELSGLIENMLQAARLQSGRVDVWLADVDIRDVVARAVRAIEPLLQVRQQRLELELPSAPVACLIDAELFGRALRNVLGNAQKHGRDGGVIRVFVEHGSDEVAVAVADDGPGIPLAEQAHVFDRFYRGRGDGGARPAGSGLGLSIARALVELQGGRVRLASRPGSGATFWLAVPVWSEVVGRPADTGTAADQHLEPLPRVPAGIRACLFDLDGVLTQTATVHGAAWKEMFDAFLLDRAGHTGEPFRPFELPDDYTAHVDGKLRADGVRTFLASRGIALPEGAPDDPATASSVHGLGARKNALVVEIMRRDGVEVYAGSVRFVKAVRAAGLRRAVVSASKNCGEVLVAAGLEDLFEVRVDGIVAEQKGLRGKPAPDMFLAAAAALAVDPAQAAVFEDALVGVAAGRAGAFGWVVGVDRVGHADALRTHGADTVVRDLGELLDQP